MNSWCFGHFLRDVFDHAYHAVLYTLYAWSSRITLISHVIMRTNFNQITKQMRDWVQTFISNNWPVTRLIKKTAILRYFRSLLLSLKTPAASWSLPKGKDVSCNYLPPCTRWNGKSADRQLSGRQMQSIQCCSDVLLFINKRTRNMKKNVSTWRFQGHHASSFK
jgi:hypothetical protein